MYLCLFGIERGLIRIVGHHQNKDNREKNKISLRKYTAVHLA